MTKNYVKNERISPIVKAVGDMIHKFRESKNISIRELAKRSGLSPSTIWKIEQGKMSPTVVVISQVAHALGKKPTELMGPVSQENFVVYMPATERSIEYSDKINIESISGHTKEWSIMANIFILKRGASSGNKGMIHDEEELAYCSRGKIQYTVDNKKYILNPRDCIHFKSARPHRWKNICNGESEIFQIIIPKRKVTEGLYE